MKEFKFLFLVLCVIIPIDSANTPELPEDDWEDVTVLDRITVGTPDSDGLTENFEVCPELNQLAIIKAVINSMKKQCIKKFKGDSISTIALSSDGKKLAIGEKFSLDGVKIVDVKSGNLICSFSNMLPKTLIFNQDGTRIFSLGLYRYVKIINLLSGEIIKEVKTDDYAKLIASHDGTRFITWDEKKLKLWSVSTTLDSCNIPSYTNTNFIDMIRFNPSGKKAAILFFGNQRALICDLESGNIIRRFPISYYSSFKISPSGSKLVACSWLHGKNFIKIYDIESGQLDYEFTYEADAIRNIALSDDGKRVATVIDLEDNLQTTIVWQLDCNGLVKQMPIEFDLYGYSISFNPDASKIIFSKENNIKIFDIQTGIKLFRKNMKAECISFSSTGSLLAVVSKLNYVKIYDIASFNASNIFNTRLTTKQIDFLMNINKCFQEKDYEKCMCIIKENADIQHTFELSFYDTLLNVIENICLC